MFLQRKIYDTLREWKKESHGRKAILIEGLRQIGKTTITAKFAEENYRTVYSFDFRSNPSQRKVFDGEWNLEAFKEDLFMLFKRPYDDEDAVLLFDEIGDCPNAGAAIKYLLKETDFDIIATGSLLGVAGFSSRSKKSPSVGFTHFVTMHSLDFEEFLWASGIPASLISKIKDCLVSNTPIEERYHDYLSNAFRHYLITGGMPEAVLVYLDTHDFSKVLATNVDKLKEMQKDFGRVIDENGEVTIDAGLLLRTNEIYEVLVHELAKDNAKFQFSMIRKGARSKEYEKAITWLVDYGLTLRCFNLRDLGLPLEGYLIPDSYKLYFGDMGLYIAKMGAEAASLLLQNEFDSYGGYIYEGIVADVLNKAGFPLYYLNDGSTELDFLLQDGTKLAILEAKMNKGQSKSARYIIEGRSNRKADLCYKLTKKNFSAGSYYQGIPHYALPFLLQLVKEKLGKSLVVKSLSLD